MKLHFVPRLFNEGGQVQQGQPMPQEQQMNPQQEGVPKMDPIQVAEALKAGEITEQDLPKVGYRNAMELRQELEYIASRMSNEGQQAQGQPQQQPMGQQPMEQQTEVPQEQMQGSDLPNDGEAIDVSNSNKVIQASSSFSSGNVSEGIRNIVESPLSKVKTGKVEGMSSMEVSDKERVITRMSKRKDEASMSVNSILTGEMDDVESIIAGLENSKYDITNNDEVRNSDNSMVINGEDGQKIEGIYQGPGFTLQVTGDYVTGVVDGKEVIKRRD